MTDEDSIRILRERAAGHDAPTTQTQQLSSYQDAFLRRLTLIAVATTVSAALSVAALITSIVIAVHTAAQLSF